MSKAYRQLKWSDIQVGHEVGRISLNMSFSRVLLSAISTLDYFPGHHDVEYAKMQGQENIYVNTMTYQGFIDRIVTDWAGPATFIARRRFSMQRPVYANDEMFGEGKVVRCYKDDLGRLLVDLQLEVGNQHGVCCPAEVTALLPA